MTASGPPTTAIDPLAVRDRLAKEGLVAADSEVRSPVPIGDGQSNLTFTLDVDERRVVVRRPPRPPFHASAHDVVREARVMAALAGTAVPVPAVLAVMEQHVDGVPAVVVEFLEGDVIANEMPARLATTDLADLVAAVARVMAAIHAVPVDRFTGFLHSGHRPYLDRQLDRYARIGADFDGPTGVLAAKVEAGLRTDVPAPVQDVLVHGDLRLGNILWSTADGGGVVLGAVLDWELAALGDPDADFAYLLMAYPDPIEDPNPISDMAGALLGRTDRPQRAELAHWYADAAARAPRRVEWFQAFVRWRAAMGLEFLRRRGARGEIPANDWIASLEAGVPAMLAQAEAHLRQDRQ